MKKPKPSPFIPPENITRKRRGDIIMTSTGYVRVAARGKVIPFTPPSHPKQRRL